MNHTVCLLAWRECGLSVCGNHWWSEVNPEAFSEETMIRAMDLAVQSVAENESRNQGREGKFTYWIFNTGEDFLALVLQGKAATKPGIFLGPSFLKTIRPGSFRMFFDGVCSVVFKLVGAAWPIPVTFVGDGAQGADAGSAAKTSSCV